MYGLVLEGGGAKGSYQVGAYKAINECGMEILAVAGTSIGALNGAMIVQGDFEACLNLWNDIRYSNIIRESDEELNRLLHSKPDRHTVKMMADKLKGVISNKGFDISPFRSMIAKYVNEDQIRSSDIDYGIVTYNLTDRVPMELFKEDIPNGEMKEYILASAFTPFFRIEKIGGKTLLDGWFYDNLPYQMLLERGYQELIILRTHQMEEEDLEDIKHLDPIVIAPGEDLGRTFDLDSSRIKKNINLGYFDAYRVIKGLKGKRYYITPENEELYFQYLRNMDPDKIRSLSRLMNIDANPGLSILFGQIIPRIGSMLDIDKNYDYETFGVALIEKLLVELDIERFNIYSFGELLQILRSNRSNFKNKEQTPYDNLLDRFGKLVPFSRESILVDAAEIIFME
ncbi:MAG: patatin-like phospholipase family protein [Bacillota bacterium]